MGKTLLKVKCTKCKLRLFEFEQGDEPGKVLMHSFGGGKGVAIDVRKLAEGIAIAICPRCATETEFDAKYLPKPQARPTLH